MNEGIPNTPKQNPIENQPLDTAQQIDKAFEVIGDAVSESANAKVQEYDERIRAAKAGTPVKPWDKVEGLMEDFKNFTKQDWSEDFSIDNFKKNKEATQQNTTQMKDPTLQQNPIEPEENPEESQVNPAITNPEVAVPEVQEKTGQDITREVLQAAFVNASSLEEETKIKTALNTMEKFFRIEDADFMHGVERVLNFVGQSDEPVGWEKVLPHFLQTLPEEKRAHLQKIRENDPERYDAYSKEMMEGFTAIAALPKNEQEDATKKLFTDLQKKYKMVWGEEDVQEEIQGLTTSIHLLKEKIGNKELTPEEAKTTQKEIAEKKADVHELLKKGGVFGGVVIGLVIGGILLAFLFELALLETVTKKVK